MMYRGLAWTRISRVGFSERRPKSTETVARLVPMIYLASSHGKVEAGREQVAGLYVINIECMLRWESRS